MSLKHIEQILKSNKTINIINLPDGGQWLSNGYACYPVKDLPKLTENNFLTILNVDAGKRDKFCIIERESSWYGVSFLDTTPDEELIDSEFLTVIYRDTAFRTFEGAGGLLFVAERYFKPFNDEDAEYTFYERFSAKTKISYIAVKKGMFLDGIILPTVFRNDTEIVRMLEEMAVLSRQAYENNITRSAPEPNHTQLSIFKGEDEE